MEIALLYSMDCFRFCPVPMHSCSWMEEVAYVFVWLKSSYPFHYVYVFIATINIHNSSILKNVPYDALLIIPPASLSLLFTCGSRATHIRSKHLMSFLEFLQTLCSNSCLGLFMLMSKGGKKYSLRSVSYVKEEIGG